MDAVHDSIKVSSDDSVLSDSCAEESTGENLSDEEEILRPTSRSLGLSKHYVADWTPKEAFRELYQNW